MERSASSKAPTATISGAAVHDGKAYLFAAAGTAVMPKSRASRDLVQSAMLPERGWAGLAVPFSPSRRTAVTRPHSYLTKTVVSPRSAAAAHGPHSWCNRIRPTPSGAERTCRTTSADRFWRVGDRLLVGGRRSTDGGPKTALYWLADDTIHQFAELPSGGDNSYPGFVELSPTRGVVSWYSSHEKDEAGKPITAIYMADLEVVE